MNVVFKCNPTHLTSPSLLNQTNHETPLKMTIDHTFKSFAANKQYPLHADILLTHWITICIYRITTFGNKSKVHIELETKSSFISQKKSSLHYIHQLITQKHNLISPESTKTRLHNYLSCWVNSYRKTEATSKYFQKSVTILESIIILFTTENHFPAKIYIP